MVRPNHHLRQQPASVQQNYVTNYTRNIPQAPHYPRGPRPMQPRNVINRNNQNNAPTQIIGLSNEPGNVGQSTIIYSPHHANINVPRANMYVQGQVPPNIHPNHNTNSQQANVYPINNQISQIPFNPQVNNQQFYPGYSLHMTLPQNIIPFSPGPHAQMQPYCFPPPQPPFPNHNNNNTNNNNTPVHLNPPSAPVINKVNDIAPPVNYPKLTVSPPQIPINPYQKKKLRPNAVLNIIDPKTGRNIADDIYGSAANTPTSREKPEKPSVITITHPHQSYHQQQQQFKQAPKVVAPSNTSFINSTVLSNSNKSSINIPISSKSISPVPVAASSRSNSPTTTATVVNSVVESEPIVPNSVSDRIEIIVDKNNKDSCNEISVTINGSHHNNDHPLTPVPEERCPQPHVESHEQQGLQEKKCEEIKIESTVIEEKKINVVPAKVEVPQKKNSGKTQKKKNKRKFKGRDINRNQNRNESTSSEDSTANSALKSLKQENEGAIDDFTTPNVIVEIKKEPEDSKSFEQNQITLKKLEILIEDYNDNEVKIKIEPKIENEQQIQSDLSKEMASTSSESEIKKEDFTFETSSFEEFSKSEGDNTNEELLNTESQTTVKNDNLEKKISEVYEECTETMINPIKIEINSNRALDDGNDALDRVRGSSEIMFFVDDMSDEDQIQHSNETEQPQNEKHSEENLQQIDNVDKENSQQIIDQVEENHQLSDKKIEENQQYDDETSEKQSKDDDNINEIHLNSIKQDNDKINQEYLQNDNKFDNEPQQSDARDQVDCVNVNVEENQMQTYNKLEEKEEKKSIQLPVREEIESLEKNLNDSSARKIYDREFLCKIRNNPICNIRPANLPDVDAVKRNEKSSKNFSISPFTHGRDHDQLFPKFCRPTQSNNTKLILPARRSFQGKAKPTKPGVIHVSLSLNENVKLRQTENAWKPTMLKKENTSAEEAATQALYKKVRSVLNKLTPQKFDTLVEQIKELEVDTLKKFEGVIDLVFQKAIDEPAFSLAYALMCKELSGKIVTNDNEAVLADGTPLDFRRLLLLRCQKEFEKSTKDENAQTIKREEINRCKDPEKKKELELQLEEENRRIKRRYLGNIKFVGELYKRNMLLPKIMHSCIEHLLQNSDEENLECLCKLLTTIGEIFESNVLNIDRLNLYFRRLKELACKKKNKKMSSRIRFMIQDVIDLRNNKWVPRRNENKPKTMDQIQKEVETERIINDLPAHRTPQNSSRRDERRDDRRDERRDERSNERNYNDRRNRGRISSSNDDWNNVSSRQKQSPFDRYKLDIASSTKDEVFGVRNVYKFHSSSVDIHNKYEALDMVDNNKPLSYSSFRFQQSKEFKPDYKSKLNDGYSSRNENQQTSLDPISASNNFRRDSFLMPQPPMPIKQFKIPTPPTPSPITPLPVPVTNEVKKPSKDENQLKNLVKSILNEGSLNNVEIFITNAMKTIEDHFDEKSYPLLVEEGINSILERKSIERQRFSALLAHMVKKNIIPLSLVQNECNKIMEFSDDLIVDIPQFWKYFAEILSEFVASDAHPFNELKRTLSIPKSKGNSGKLLGELLSKLVKDRDPKWLVDSWNQSGLKWNDLVDPNHENIDNIFKLYNLQFLVSGLNNNNAEKLSDNNLSMEQIRENLFKLLKDSSIENITSWISLNVGEQSKQPQFVDCLMTTILKISIEPIKDTWRLKPDTFTRLLPLIDRYAGKEMPLELQLQCLYSIQVYNDELSHPQGVLLKIIDLLTAAEHNILSDNAYLEWEKADKPLIEKGHGVAIKTLTSFFTVLRERDDFK